MSQKSFFTLFLTVMLCSAGIGVTSCAVIKPESRERDDATIPEKAVYTEEEVSGAERAFIRGVTAMQLDDKAMALSYLKHAESIMKSSSGVNYALAELYYEMEEYGKGIFYAQKAVDLEPENKWYRLLLADGYAITGNKEEVIGQLDAILEQNPNNRSVLYMKAQTLSSLGKYEASNKVYEQLLEISGPDPTLFYYRIGNFRQMEDHESMMSELQRIIELHPDNINTLLMMSQFYLEKDNEKEARKVLEKILEHNPGHAETLVNLADLYIQQKKWEKAGEILMGLVADEDISILNKLEIVQYVTNHYSNDKDNPVLEETASLLIATLLEAEEESALAHALSAEFFLMKDEQDQALFHLKRTTELMPENDAAWRQLVQFYYIEGRYGDAVEAGEKSGQYIAEDPFISFFVGGAYYIKEEYQKAIEWLTAASELPSRPEFRSVILGTLGDTYASVDYWEDAVEAYEASLALDSDNSVTLNNYAYYLSEREERLDEAYDMSARALEINPANGAFLDTMGWIYFKKGNYPKAKKYIRKAIETGEASAEVMEHMGDVYDKLEDPDRALYWWQKAFEKEENRIHLKERLHINGP